MAVRGVGGDAVSPGLLPQLLDTLDQISLHVSEAMQPILTDLALSCSTATACSPRTSYITGKQLTSLLHRREIRLILEGT